jgi:HlyD family type I secretion membrane fusion protein
MTAGLDMLPTAASPVWPDDAARPAIAAGMAIVVVFFGVIGTWASFAPLDSAALAAGVVKVEGNRKSVQHLEGGIVKELRVRDGDAVAEGQTLLVLDNPQADAAFTILRKQHLELLAQEARLNAERSGAARIAYPELLTRKNAEPEAAGVMTAETALFNSRRAALQGQIELIRRRIGQADEQAVGLRAQRDAQRKQLASTREELDGLRDLFKRGYVPRQRMMELDRHAASLEGQALESDAQILRLGQHVEELKLQMIQLQSDRLQQVDNEIRDVRARLLEALPRMQAARDVLERIELRAPYAGRVVGLSVFSVGAVIGRGERILDIVPETGELIVEANLSVDDIRDIRPGMRAEVRLTAYKQRTVPIVYGTISHVSADRLTDSRSGVPYYQVQVKIDPEELKRAGDLRLLPGMAAELSIPTGARTAMDYLLAPLTDTMQRSFRER